MRKANGAERNEKWRRKIKGKKTGTAFISIRSQRSKLAVKRKGPGRNNRGSFSPAAPVPYVVWQVRFRGKLRPK